MPDYLHLPYNEIVSTLEDILVKNSFSKQDSRTLAEIFATNSLEGVYSHGVNRFPRFMEYLKDGHIKPDRKAVLKHAAGSIEQWDGQSGPGPVNALIATERAMDLARQYGMGCVALANTNHWMRGGTYAWIAARAGFAYISWTNTIANLPAWGAKDARLGNNPLVIGVPNNGEAIVVDLALSQYSFGALEVKKQNNQMLPMPGGYDKDGNLTTDPTAIIESWRALPIGYWKGAGLSLLLDLLGTILSGGLSVSDITASGAETNSSQIFIAFDVSKLHNFATFQATINGIIDDFHASFPEKEGSPVRYPGESVLRIRKENLAKGIPVLKEVWERIVVLR